MSEQERVERVARILSACTEALDNQHRKAAIPHAEVETTEAPVGSTGLPG